MVLPEHISTHNWYEIESKRESASAFLLFARHMVMNDSVVIKVLRAYKDTRYSLETVSERQQCQLEALQWNRVFTPEAYIGLASICNHDDAQRRICIGDIIKNPTIMEDLLSDRDYALVMKRLPDNRRLDNLLKDEENLSLEDYLYLLVKYIVYMHANLPLSLSPFAGPQWGSLVQLQEKLQQNLALLDQAFAESEHGRYSDYIGLKEDLSQVLTWKQYQYYFEHRVKEQRIKRCHGDLKTSNIWIAPYNDDCDQEPWRCIWLLDTIDFNPAYCNIDMLSDVAMLAIDIQARTQSSRLADFVIESYLRLTGQQDEVARLVLAYYLVEKALVSAAITILYENLPALGRKFLEVSKIHMDKLKYWIDVPSY